jgi:hypothetical protein
LSTSVSRASLVLRTLKGGVLKYSQNFTDNSTFSCGKDHLLVEHSYALLSILAMHFHSNGKEIYSGLTSKDSREGVTYLEKARK